MLRWLFVLSFQSLHIQKTWKLVPSTLKLFKTSEDFSFHLFTIGMNLHCTIQNLPFGENWSMELSRSSLPGLNYLRHTFSWYYHCYCWVSCAVVFSVEHAQRWPFLNGDLKGHRTSVHFSLLDFRGFSVCMAVLVVFYQGLPVWCLYGTGSFVTATCGKGFTVFVKCSMITSGTYWRTSGINVEIHAK